MLVYQRVQNTMERSTTFGWTNQLYFDWTIFHSYLSHYILLEGMVDIVGYECDINGVYLGGRWFGVQGVFIFPIYFLFIPIQWGAVRSY